MLFKLFFLFLVFCLIVTCTFESTGPTVVASGPNRPRLALATISITEVIPEPILVAEFSTEILFSKGKQSVPSQAKAEIKKMFEQAKKVGRIQSAQIISWADQLRSHKKKSALSSAQLKLVEDRNDNLEAYLEKLDLQMNVRKISMAEKPEVMDELLAKDDRQLKDDLEFTDGATASKSIIMFVLKKK